MTPSRLIAAPCVLASLLLAPAALLAARQEQAPPRPPRPGQVAGRVVEFDNTPLPGFGVVLIGPFPSNARRTTVSNADARFVFPDLQPGRYRLAIDMPDINPRSNVDVTVNPGQRTETVLVLSLLGTQVNVVVRAEAPAVADVDLSDADSLAGLRVIPGTIIENMPLPAEQALEVLPLLPGVVRAPDGQLAIDGTMPTDSVLLFNGIDLTDAYSGDHSIRLPVEAIDSVDLFTGVAPASYGDYAGGIVDITTAAGGESWDWGVASFIPRPRFADGTLQGLGHASPRVSVNGPIKPGETYVSLAGEYHFDRVRVYDVPGDPPQDHVREQGWNAFGQFDWRPNDTHNFTFVGLVFPSYDKFVGLGGLTPPEATLNIERDAEAALIRYRYREDANRSLMLTAQYNRIGLRSEGQGDAPYEVGTGGFGGNHFHSEDRQTSHLQGQLLLRRRFPGAGGRSHVFQLGGDFHRLDLSGRQEDGTALVRGVDGRLLQRIDLARETRLDQHEYEWSFFAQDRWTYSERFWLDYGLRYSGDSYSADHRFAPRVGAAWDPIGDRRTLIKGGIGIVHRRIYMGEIAWEQLPARLETTYHDDGTATLRTLVPTIGGEDLDAPRTFQYTFDLSHRLESGWLFRARYSSRDTDENIIVDRVEGTGVTIDAGVDPRSLVATPEALESAGQLLLSSTGEANTRSIELTVARRIPTGGDFFFSYVRSSSFGDLNDFTLLTADFPDVIIRPNRRATRRFEAPHRVVAWAMVEMPMDIRVTPAVEWRSGFPYSVLAEDQSYLGEPNAERFPDFFALDVQATKAFVIKGYRVTGGVKITNLTGHDNPRQVVANSADPLFGDLRNSVPFKVRAKFSVSF